VHEVRNQEQALVAQKSHHRGKLSHSSILGAKMRGKNKVRKTGTFRGTRDNNDWCGWKGEKRGRGELYKKEFGQVTTQIVLRRKRCRNFETQKRDRPRNLKGRNCED